VRQGGSIIKPGVAWMVMATPWNQGRRQKIEGEGGQCIVRWGGGVNTVKTLTFEKGGVA